MTFSVSVSSFSSGAIVSVIVATLMVVAWRGRSLGGLLLFAMIMTTLWASVCLLVAAGWISNHVYTQPIEIIRNLSWYWFLLQILMGGKHAHPRWFSVLHARRYLAWAGCIAASTLVLFVHPRVPIHLDIFAYQKWWLVSLLLFTVVGIAIVEQVVRNVQREQRWAIKFLCLGLGAVFAYDFYMYAESLLVNAVDRQLWAARGFLWVLVAPLVGISAARCTDWSVAISLSRRFVFHSAALIGAGVYLVVMSIGGFYIRAYGGAWGTVVQISFLFGSVLLLLVLLFSGHVRAYAKVFLSKHLFSYRFDYREQWLRFTQTLSAANEGSIGERVVYAMSQLVDSPGGCMWCKDPGGGASIYYQWGVLRVAVQGDPITDDLIEYFSDAEWIIELEDYRYYPENYSGIVLPDWLYGQ